VTSFFFDTISIGTEYSLRLRLDGYAVAGYRSEANLMRFAVLDEIDGISADGSAVQDELQIASRLDDNFVSTGPMAKAY
jgi:hypothetical protein